MKRALLCATFIFSTSALANPVPMETSNICKAKVEGRSLNSVEQLVRLTNHWINNQVDSEKVKQLTDFLNQNPSPANPFENGFERGDVQLNVVFQLLLNQITDQDWLEYVNAIITISDEDQQQREKIAHIDHEESLTAFELRHFSPTPVQNPRDDNPPAIVTLKDQKSYVFIDAHTSTDDVKIETQIYSVDQETLQLHQIGQLNLSNLLPSYINTELVRSAKFISTPIPVDEQRFLVFIDIEYRNDLNSSSTSFRVFAEINALTGETYLISELSKSDLISDLKPLVVSEKEIYFANIVEENGNFKKISFMKLNSLSREVEEVKTFHNPVNFPIQIIQKENGDILWVSKALSPDQLEVFTLEHSTGKFQLNSKISRLENIERIDQSVFYMTPSGQWIASIISSGKLSLFTFDPGTHDFKLFGAYSNPNYPVHSQTFFESQSGVIYLATGLGENFFGEIALLKIDPKNQIAQSVTSFQTENEVQQELKISKGFEDRIFLTSIDFTNTLVLFEFLESNETFIPLQELRIPFGNSVGRLMQNDTSVFLPVTYGGSELHVHQVSIGEKK